MRAIFRSSNRYRYEIFASSRTSNTNPWATLDFGEVEDYTVNITGGSGFDTPGFIATKSAVVEKGMSVFPNPIAGSTAIITYSLPNDGQLSLKVVN